MIDPRESPLYPLIRGKLSKLSKRQRIRLSQKRPTGQWLYPWALERTYARQIGAWMKELTGAATEWLEQHYPLMLAGYHSDALGDDLNSLEEFLQAIDSKLFGEQSAERMAYLKKLAEDVQGVNQGQFGKFLNQYADGVFFPREAWLGEVVGAWAATNFTLIKSLSQEYIKRLNSLVGDAVQDGRTWNVVAKDVQGLNNNITKSKSKLLARDQIGKLNGRITERRQQEAGIDQYDWSTSRDERVRGNPLGLYPKAKPSHFIMEGVRCRWDDATVYSEDGGRTWKPRTGKMPKQHPGQPIQCRCTALPVFDEIVRAADTDIAIDEGDVQQFEEVQEVQLPEPKVEMEKKKETPNEYLKRMFAKVEAAKRKGTLPAGVKAKPSPTRKRSTKPSFVPTEEAKKAVEGYTGNGYINTNNYLRDGKRALPNPLDEPDIKKRVKVLDDFLSAAPKHEGDVYRVMSFGEEKYRDEFFKKLKKGAIFKDKAFMSTTKAKEVIESTMASQDEGTTMWFKIKNSRRGVDVSNISFNPVEEEVLFPRNSAFRIVDKTFADGGKNVFVTLEEI